MYATPYVFFNGNCAEALGYYEKALDARTIFRNSYGETPAKEHVSKDLHDKVIHAVLLIGNTAVMMSDDCMPNAGTTQHGGYALTLSTDSLERARKVFDALADGGKVTMALDKTFFAAAFGSVEDRFGIRWMVICEKGT